MSVLTVLRQSMPSSSRLFPRATATATFCSSTIASSSTSTSPPARKPKAAKALSSCLPGTTLTGLSVLKDKPDPVALPDDQYPSWLWTLLDANTNANATSVGKSEKSSEEFDAVKEKRKLKSMSREKIKASNYLKSTT